MSVVVVDPDVVVRRDRRRAGHVDLRPGGVRDVLRRDQRQTVGRRDRAQRQRGGVGDLHSRAGGADFAFEIVRRIVQCDGGRRSERRIARHVHVAVRADSRAVADRSGSRVDRQRPAGVDIGEDNVIGVSQRDVRPRRRHAAGEVVRLRQRDRVPRIGDVSPARDVERRPRRLRDRAGGGNLQVPRLRRRPGDRDVDRRIRIGVGRDIAKIDPVRISDRDVAAGRHEGPEIVRGIRQQDVVETGRLRRKRRRVGHRQDAGLRDRTGGGHREVVRRNRPKFDRRGVVDRHGRGAEAHRSAEVVVEVVQRDRRRGGK